MGQRSFFVYVDRKPCGEPFYVGKGTKARVARLDRRTRHHSNITAKYPGWTRTVLCEGTEEYCFFIENRAILTFGRLDKKTGTLINLTDGGEGASGSIKSDKARALQSESMRKAWSDPESRERMSAPMRGEKNPNYGRSHTEEARDKIREAKIGKKAPAVSEANRLRVVTEETREKMSKAHRSRAEAGIPGPNRGKKRSEEAKAKTSASLKAFYAARRNSPPRHEPLMDFAYVTKD
jgi:hypothetical protein